MVIDLSAEHAPIMVKRQPNGGLTIKQGESLILMDDAALTEFIRIAQPPATPAKEQQHYRLG